MFHFFGTATNTRGDSLSDWQVEVVQFDDGETVVPIFSDENSTPILAASGIANRAKTTALGNYDFWVPNGQYSLRFYDDAGVFQRLQRGLQMYGAPDPITINDQTGTSYTLVLSDAYNAVALNNASAITLTIPPDTDVSFLDGTFLELHQMGAGVVTVTAGTGVTINSNGDRADTAGQHAVAGLRKTGASTWLLFGDIT